MMTEIVREVERIKKEDGKFFLRFPNGKQGEEYKAVLIFENVFFKSYEEHQLLSKTKKFIVKEVSGKELGITCELSNDKKSLIVSGVVSKDINGNFELELVLDGDKSIPPYPGCIFVNPDPRLLWKNIPTDPQIVFYKEDEDFASISANGTVVSKKIVPPRVIIKKVVEEKLSEENSNDSSSNVSDKLNVTEDTVKNNVIEFKVEESANNNLAIDNPKNNLDVKKEYKDSSQEVTAKDKDLAIKNVDDNSAQEASTEVKNLTKNNVDDNSDQEVSAKDKNLDIKNIDNDSVLLDSIINKDEKDNDTNSISQKNTSDKSDIKSKDSKDIVDHDSNNSIIGKFLNFFCKDKCNDNKSSDNLQSSEVHVLNEKEINNELCLENQINKFERLNIIAGSKRGRSHAHAGTPRDDDFAIDYIEESGWHIAVVADGAGSAKYSREGSRIACDVVIKTCREKLQNNDEIDTLFGEAKNLKSKSTEEKKKLKESLRKKIYGILPHAAFEAKKHLEKLSSDTDGSSLKDFSTTLLICLCKKYDDLWHFVTFSIGDGAIALYGSDKVNNLSDGDSGEFAGQTRFPEFDS